MARPDVEPRRSRLAPGGLLQGLNEGIGRLRQKVREATNTETLRRRHEMTRIDATLLGRPDPGPLPARRRR